MKVALCHHYSLTFHGGGERFIIDVAKQLNKRGHKAVIYSLPFSRRSIDAYHLLRGIEYYESFIHNIDDADIAYFIYAPLVHHLFLGECPKIGAIHSFIFLHELQHPDINSMNYLSFVRKFGFKRFLSHFYFEKIGRKNLNFFDAIHVINKEALNIFRGVKRVYYVPNWINTSIFKPKREKNERFSVLFIGRKAKEYSLFVKIANCLKRKRIDFIAVGPDLESIGNVKSLGLITDTEKLIELYSQVHVMLHTSKTDVFPMSLLEAAACGVPIISFPTKAIKGINLPIFYASSVVEFTQKICELENIWWKEREEYIKLANRMREAVMKYDVNVVFPKFLRMLKEVAEDFN